MSAGCVPSEVGAETSECSNASGGFSAQWLHSVCGGELGRSPSPTTVESLGPFSESTASVGAVP